MITRREFLEYGAFAALFPKDLIKSSKSRLGNLKLQDYLTTIKEFFKTLDTSYIGVWVNPVEKKDFDNINLTRTDSFSNILIEAVYNTQGGLFVGIGTTKLKDFTELENLIKNNQYKEAQEFVPKHTVFGRKYTFTDNELDGIIDDKYPAEKASDENCIEAMKLLARELEKIVQEKQ